MELCRTTLDKDNVVLVAFKATVTIGISMVTRNVTATS